MSTKLIEEVSQGDLPGGKFPERGRTATVIGSQCNELE